MKNLSSVGVGLVVLLILVGWGKCARDVDHDRVKIDVHLACKGGAACESRVEERFDACYAEDFGSGVFFLVSKTDSSSGRSAYHRLKVTRIAACVATGP